MTAAQTKLVRKAPVKRKATARPQVSAKWRKLLCVLPGYDPFEQAGKCWFDADEAQWAIDYFQHFIKHAKGPLAGKPFILSDWQQCIVANVFGWKRPDGTRRFREIFIYVPKKNGKTAFVAGILLMVMTADHEIGAELYSAAASREQASLLFKHCVGMIRYEPELARRLTVFGAKGGSVNKSITFDDEMAVYNCLSADANTADGASPHFSAIDELHRHKSPELAELLQTSTAIRTQPLTFYTTTADYNRPSLCNSMLKRARAVRDNGGDPSRPGYDETFLPAIYEASNKDNWEDPVVWASSNPNLGVTIPHSFFNALCKRAVEEPSYLNNFLRLHLNIVTDSVEAWLRMDRWDECPSVNPEDLIGRRCWAGLDLSSTIDLSALVLVFEPGEDGVIPVLPFFWVPEERMRDRVKRDKVPYDVWVREGLITATPGDIIDYGYIRHQINESCELYNVIDIGFDPYNAKEFCINQLQEQDGITVVEFRQGYLSMNEPAKRLEAMVISKKLAHNANPVLRWMAGNTVARKDPAGNIKPDKEKSSEKIDGIVSLIMGVWGMMANEQGGRSVYEDRGLSII